ncbi:MAG: cytochrome c3 family protein [Gemmataceae bacterium]
MFSPGALSERKKGGPARGGVASHAEIAGNCAACHPSPWSGQTMADRCLECHSDVQTQVAERGPLHGRISGVEDCRACHTEHRGRNAVITNLQGFDHAWAAFPLTGKHTDLACEKCHRTEVYKSTPQTCEACHAEPSVHRGRFGSNCASCHSTATFKGALFKEDATSFDHSRTAFKLTGKHAGVDCKSCHVGGVFKGTSQSCVSCHAEPVVHKGRFGDNCSSCHSTATFKGALFREDVAKFDHNLTAFKLTGKHASVDCKSCHVGGVFKGTSQSCVSCHAEPVVHKGRFGTNCSGCHETVTWKGAVFKPDIAKFDHNVTRFKLTGKHAATECKACHVDGVFKGTAQTCVSCHKEPAAPAVHKARYGAACANCHTTVSFRGATFKHAAFPINHGARRSANTCATCHPNPANFNVYTCVNCHEHEPARIARIHAKRRVADLNNCVKCHKGRRGERREKVDLLEFLEAWADGESDLVGFAVHETPPAASRVGPGMGACPHAGPDFLGGFAGTPDRPRACSVSTMGAAPVREIWSGAPVTAPEPADNLVLDTGARKGLSGALVGGDLLRILRLRPIAEPVGFVGGE